MVDLRALDDAARVAAVLGLAAALLDVGGQGLAGDLLGIVELARTEVLGGQGAGLVDDVDQDGGAEAGQALAGDGMTAQDVDPLLAGVLEELLVAVFGLGVGGAVEDDGLDALGTHDRAHAAATGGTGGQALGVGELDGGGGQALLAGGADHGGHGLVAVGGQELFLGSVGAHAGHGGNP